MTKLTFHQNSSINSQNVINSDNAIRLKQVLIWILDNLIENTKEGVIEVNVNSINKYDVCRLIITIENSGIPLSLEEINNILDNEKEIDENISLEDINKLINMMNGSLNIKSEEGNEFTISIDSIIVIEIGGKIKYNISCWQSHLNVKGKIS